MLLEEAAAKREANFASMHQKKRRQHSRPKPPQQQQQQQALPFKPSKSQNSTPWSSRAAQIRSTNVETLPQEENTAIEHENTAEDMDWATAARRSPPRSRRPSPPPAKQPRVNAFAAAYAEAKKKRGVARDSPRDARPVLPRDRDVWDTPRSRDRDVWDTPRPRDRGGPRGSSSRDSQSRDSPRDSHRSSPFARHPRRNESVTSSRSDDKKGEDNSGSTESIEKLKAELL